MNCKSYGDLMMKYFDGDCNDIEFAQLKLHMKTCKTCAEEFENLGVVMAGLNQYTSPEPPQDFEVQVMNRINTLEYASKRKFKNMLTLLLCIIAAGIIFAVMTLGWNEHGITESMGKSGQLAGYFSSFTVVLMSMSNVALDVFSAMLRTLVNVNMAIVKTYYNVFIVLGAMFIAVQTMLTYYIRQSYGGAK